MMLQESTRETLEMFVEKASLMQNRAYWQFFREGKEISVSFGIDPISDAFIDLEFVGPSVEARDALLITLRLFLQDNDCISLRNLAKLSVIDHGLSSEWHQEFPSLRDTANDLLNESLEVVAKQIGMSKLTAHDVLHTFLYGEIAHMNSEKRKLYQCWKGLSVFPLLEFSFTATVASFLCVVSNTAELAASELARAHV